MIDTKVLREKILDLAMRGKLVPQNPNDEPASELLKRIKAEKEELIKQKKIKRDKNETEIFRGDDGLYYEKFADGTVKEIEVPYELPNGWEWTKLITLTAPVAVPMADGPFGSNLKTSHYTVDKEVRIIQLSNIGEDGIWKDDNVKYTTFEHLKIIERSEVKPGNLVIAKMMPAGKAMIAPSHEKAYVLSSDAVKFVPNKKIDSELLLNFINSSVFREQVYSEVQGITRARTSLSKLKNYLIPVPPVVEQTKILEALKEYYNLVGIIHKEQDSLQQLTEQLKKKALDVAMQGKLVPQDPNDEPASILLEKIRAEKQKLYEQGKLKKKDLEETTIVKGEDNAYYEKFVDGTIKLLNQDTSYYPTNWSLIRLRNLTKIIGDGLHGTPKYDENGEYYFINGSNLIDGRVVITEGTKRVNQEEFDKHKKWLDEGTILMSINGTLGKLAKYDKEPIILGKSAAYMNLVDNKMTNFLYFVLSTPVFTKYYDETYTGSVIKNVPLSAIRDAIIPVPPLEEQSRILKKVTEALSLVENIEKVSKNKKIHYIN